jgi:polysaccharide biosynthesis/export protein
MRQRFIVFLICLLSPLPLAGADIASSSGDTGFEPNVAPVSDSQSTRVLLATSSMNYPVTPGDVYKITYIRLNQVVSMEAIVLNDYSLNLSLFGTIDTRAITYPELRRRIEKLVLSAYPNSIPQVTLSSTGVFLVHVSGEVRRTELVQCWGFTRVSEVIRSRLTQYASMRNISIVSGDGTKRQADLFIASRKGILDQDPIVKPDDTIIAVRASRKVEVGGAVYKPGTYELLEGENLMQLINDYAEGMTKTANEKKISIVRIVPGTNPRGEALSADMKNPLFGKIELKDFDTVVVGSYRDELPTVFFEGAVGITSPDNDPTIKLTGRIPYSFTPGETLVTAARNMQKNFSALALLEGVYILREGGKNAISIDLAALLLGNPSIADIPLVQGDRIVIPLRQFFVTVSGGVISPGRYPYIPDRSYMYYINGAGGFDPEKNAGAAVSVLDAADKSQPLDRPIQPEDRINAEVNNIAYYINQWAPVISVSVSVVALVVAVAQLLK